MFLLPLPRSIYLHKFCGAYRGEFALLTYLCGAPMQYNRMVTQAKLQRVHRPVQERLILYLQVTHQHQ